MKISRKQLALTAVIGGLMALWLKPSEPRHQPAGHRVQGDPRAGLNAPGTRSARDKTESYRSPTISAASAGEWESNLVRLIKSLRDETTLEDQARLRVAVAAVSVDQIPALLEKLNQQFTESERSLAVRLLIEQWAAQSPALAASWVDQHLDSSDRSNVLARVSGIWAAADPTAAWDWGRQLLEADDRATALNGAALEIAHNNPSLAFSFAEQLPRETAEEVITKAASSWTEKSVSEVLDAARSLKSESLQNAAIGSIAIAWAEANPASAAKLAVESLPAGDVQNDAVIGVLQRWTQADPVSAAAWASVFPAGELGDTAAENLVKLWTDRDPNSVGKWISSLEPGKRRDAATAAYGEKLSTRSPEIAALWIDQIADQKLRRQYMENLAEVWLSADPAAAQSWITRAELPSSQAQGAPVTSADRTVEPSRR